MEQEALEKLRKFKQEVDEFMQANPHIDFAKAMKHIADLAVKLDMIDVLKNLKFETCENSLKAADKEAHDALGIDDRHIQEAMDAAVSSEESLQADAHFKEAVESANPLSLIFTDNIDYEALDDISPLDFIAMSVHSVIPGYSKTLMRIFKSDTLDEYYSVMSTLVRLCTEPIKNENACFVAVKFLKPSFIGNKVIRKAFGRELSKVYKARIRQTLSFIDPNTHLPLVDAFTFTRLAKEVSCTNTSDFFNLIDTANLPTLMYLHYELIKYGPAMNSFKTCGLCGNPVPKDHKSATDGTVTLHQLVIISGGAVVAGTSLLTSTDELKKRAFEMLTTRLMGPQQVVNSVFSAIVGAIDEEEETNFQLTEDISAQYILHKYSSGNMAN